MDNKVICPKGGLLLRKVGSQYMIVESCAGNVNMSNVYTLNATAARLWEWLGENGSTAARLAERLASAYGIDIATANEDVCRQLAEWEDYGLVEISE